MILSILVGCCAGIGTGNLIRHSHLPFTARTRIRMQQAQAMWVTHVDCDYYLLATPD